MKKILGTSEAWSLSRLSHQLSKPTYYIEDCLISTEHAVKRPNSQLKQNTTLRSVTKYANLTLKVT